MEWRHVSVSATLCCRTDADMTLRGLLFRACCVVETVSITDGAASY